MEGFDLNLKNIGTRLFGIDLRALGVYRIAFAIALLVDLSVRAMDITAFYTDAGVFPVAAYKDFWALPWFWSLHALSGSYAWEAVLMALAAVSAFCLLIGWRTKLFTWVCWLLLISIQNRTPVVLQGADQVLRLVMFFSLFVPWGRRYSLDARRHPEWYGQQYALTPGTAALLLQVAYIYLFSYLLKTGAEWHTYGSAIYYALSLDQFATHLGRKLLEYPNILPSLTFGVLRLELIIPILFFVPVFIKESRIIGVVLTIGLQLGLALSLTLGHFPLINIFAVLVFLPREVWDWLEARLPFMRPAKTIGEIKPRIMSPAYKILHYAAQSFAGLMAVYLFWWNIGTIEDLQTDVPPAWQTPAYLTRTDQVWDLFGPYPMKDDGWYVMPGQLTNGKLVDVWRPGKKVTFDKPAYVPDDFRNYRWQKYMGRLWDKRFNWLRPLFADYMCRQWNTTHPASERLKAFDIYYREELTLPEGTPPRMSTHRLLSWECGG